MNFDADNASQMALGSGNSYEASSMALFERVLKQIFSPSTVLQQQKTQASKMRSRDETSPAMATH